MGKAAPAIYTVHSTAPAYQENRVLVSARDATTTTYVVHALFQPVPCNCYTNTCDAFDGSCVWAWSGTFQLQCPLSWKYALPRQGGCATRIRLRCVCNETFGSPNCNVRSCLHCPLHSFCLEKAQTSTLSGRASVKDGSRGFPNWHFSLV